MTARTVLLAVVALCSGCATELGGVGRTREQLDEYILARPLAEAWPEALRFLNERGYPPVGADRALVGLSPMGSWSAAVSKGQETQVSAQRRTAETAEDSTGKRYRIIGVDLGPPGCRIGFFAIRDARFVEPIEERARESMTRDTNMELAFLERVAPADAAKMRPKDPGFF